MRVRNDIIAVGEHTLDVAIIVGEFLAEEGDIGFQPFQPVGGIGTVLDVARAEKFRRRRASSDAAITAT
jgi:hypothetical protein